MSRNIFLSIEYITLDRLDTSIYAGLIRSDVVMTMECAPRLREENIQRNLDLTRRIAHETHNADILGHLSDPRRRPSGET